MEWTALEDNGFSLTGSLKSEEEEPSIRNVVEGITVETQVGLNDL